MLMLRYDFFNVLCLKILRCLLYYRVVKFKMSKKNSLLFKGNYLLKYFLGISIVLYKILYSF